MNVRVLLVDDNREFRQALERFLGGFPDVHCVGTAGNGLEALAAIRDLKPDLVLMDIVMPQMDGFEATLQIKRLPAPPRVVMLSLHEDEEYRRRAREAGADGYIPKSQFPHPLPGLIRRLFGGGEKPL